MPESRQSAPIRGAQGNVSYELVFIDDRDSDTVLMRVTVAPSGEVHEERVPRDAADGKLTSPALINDVIDARLLDLLSR